ncbi:MAG TPA: hypothetical protein PK385_05625 [Spirochaetota bacterium]|nr:MAG: hypothetical protein BWX91_01608 [Spirochaetes bacterium ADurb.Bin133]HNZ26667.1 hypothetical protein [Spirochaetota bacterium]HOF00491.1 hypothetical protein [Spirochaetota bacterium]HOS32923.1 hypothetical protein [Spirochaetota bacterium]HOS55517.1 hypothetical protein [Spirochaetota bacterium]
MSKFLYLFIVFVFVCSCSVEKTPDSMSKINDTTKVKTVTIKSGTNYTVHKVNEHNLVTNSSYVDKSGALIEREYIYGNDKDLATVVKTNSITGTEIIGITTTETRAGDKVVKKIKTRSDSRGKNSVLTVDYYYDSDDNVVGVVQTDSYGNIIAKGVDK